MLKLVRLSRERERRMRAERQSIRSQLVAQARAVTDGIDGYALVAFRHSANGQLDTWTDYGVRDAADLFVLPDLIKEKIRKRINDEAEPVDD